MEPTPLLPELPGLQVEQVISGDGAEGRGDSRRSTRAICAWSMREPEALQAKQQHDQYMQSLAATQQVVIDLQRLITGHIVTTATTALTGRPAGETLVELAPAVEASRQDGAQSEGVAASNGHRPFRQSR